MCKLNKTKTDCESQRADHSMCQKRIISLKWRPVPTKKNGAKLKSLMSRDNTKMEKI